MQHTRDSYRRLFGTPDDKGSHPRVMIFSCCYLAQECCVNMLLVFQEFSGCLFLNYKRDCNPMFYAFAMRWWRHHIFGISVWPSINKVCDVISLYLVEEFTWNLPQIIIFWMTRTFVVFSIWGQRSSSLGLHLRELGECDISLVTERNLMKIAANIHHTSGKKWRI